MAAVRLATSSHRIEVWAEARDDVQVEGTARVTTVGERTTIDEARTRLVIRVPEGSDLVLGTSSGRVEISGSVGAVAVVTESGRIRIERARSVDARTTSARVEVGHVEGECRVHTASGRIEIGGCGRADAATVSGRIDLRHVRGPVRAHCVSGHVSLQLDVASDVDAETVTGRITVSVPAGARVRRIAGIGSRAAGSADHDCTVRASSVSGRIEVSQR